MDERPLATSRHLIVIHLTDVQNSSATFRDAEQTILTNWGTLPHLVRRGAADIRIKSDDSASTTVWAVHLDGNPAHQIAVRREGESLEFTAATVQPQGTFLVYEIKRQ